jgi:cellobiose phosphorylase
MSLQRANDPNHGADVPARACILSNGAYRTLVTSAGTGYSAFNGSALTRWRGDRVEDGDGFFLYLRDVEDDRAWSSGFQPSQQLAARYVVHHEAGKFVIVRQDSGIETQMEVCVHPEENFEVRRITLRNLSGRPRRIEATSYVEVVLNDPAADTSHPAFSKLFIQTESAERALLARRRPRGVGEQSPWLVHAIAGEKTPDGPLEWETDRMRFLGRGHRLAEPAALRAPLSGTVGNVLDPVLSLRRAWSLAPGAGVEFSFLLGAAPEREAALMLARRWMKGDLADVFERAGERERALIQRLGLAPEVAAQLQTLAAAMLYRDPHLRAAADILARAKGSLNQLGDYGLLPGQPLILARVAPSGIECVDELLLAREYWLHHGLAFNFAFLVAGPEMARVAARVREQAQDDESVKVLKEDAIPPRDRDFLQAMADCLVTGSGWLPAVEQGPSHGFSKALPNAADVGEAGPSDAREPARPLSGDNAPQQSLRFYNGYGGFSRDGSEYVIPLPETSSGKRRLPPLPWINVIANERVGFLVSETGAGYSWSGNSREHRLTPWHNDPVLDSHGEALYVRDENTGEFWSPLPGPATGPGDYEARHGFGYSRFHHVARDLEQDVCLFVPRSDPVKIICLRLAHRGENPKRLSLFSYQRLVLGENPEQDGRFIATEYDPVSGALLARNRFANGFADGLAFAAPVAPEAVKSVYFTADRSAFIGRYGTPATPAALSSATPLDGRTGAGLDPCAAFQLVFDLAPGETLDCAFLLGEIGSLAEVRKLIQRYRADGAIEDALDEVSAFWTDTLSAIRIETPFPEIDVMVNGWLAYQNLACRLWGRSAFYQSGGAFGFRDQLQDAAALVYLRPELTRKQILLHAAHQFIEGDVLHWWHPEPMERGLRTRFADDLLWLPYVTAFYVRTTGDWSVLDEPARFITARRLKNGEDEAYLKPKVAAVSADVYEHCCRALDRSLTRGPHGLPLMGTGDWNDGMNRVGREGRGESVWMGFFLHHIIDAFRPLCERRADRERMLRYQAYRDHLRIALNDAGWDGEWYRRAYYDDGTPLGSSESDECRIDALAQAWAVISRAAPHERAVQAMDAVEKYLISDQDRLIRLLTPPFDQTPHDPGYIKGYVPGVRENGGQYTHAALWVVRAMSELGRNHRAAELLRMLSPVRHAQTPEGVAVYQVEPYVIAADIYGAAPHIGRGGWTWYTGSAGWMYRVALESVLGFRLINGDTLVLKPCVPASWTGFSVSYRLPDGKTRYDIRVENPNGKGLGITAAIVDGKPGTVDQGAARVPLVQDGANHRVRIILG